MKAAERRFCKKFRHPADLTTPAVPYTAHSTRTADRVRSFRVSRRSRLKVWGALGSIAVGFAFSYVVAADDRPPRIFVLVVTSLGLFTVISGLIAQLGPVETLHEPAPPRDPEGARPVPRPPPPEPPTSEPNSPPR